MKTQMLEIDSEKLKKFVEDWGGNAVVSRKLHRSYTTISNTIKRGMISHFLADAIEETFDCPYGLYKKTEEEKTETDKGIIAILQQISNNQLAIYKRLNQLTETVGRIEEIMEVE